MTYAEQLRHPLWQRRRLEILSRAQFKCERCYADDLQLHVHHKIYRKGAKAWEYDDRELVALCEECHESEHLIRQELAAVLANLGDSELQSILGFAKSVATFAIGADIDTDAVRVRSAEEATGLGAGLGLSFLESHHLLAKAEPIPATLIQRLKRDAWKRSQRALGGRFARTPDELTEIANSFPSAQSENDDL